MEQIKKHLAFYLVIGSDWPTETLLARCLQAVEDGVTCLDLLGDDPMRTAAVKQAASQCGLPFITQYGGGDGLYLNDLTELKQKRAQFGKQALLGCTIQNAQEATAAGEADFVGVNMAVCTVAQLAEICRVCPVPVVAYNPGEISPLKGLSLSGVGLPTTRLEGCPTADFTASIHQVVT